MRSSLALADRLTRLACTSRGILEPQGFFSQGEKV